MSSFLIRTITGLFLVLIVVGSIMFSSLTYCFLFLLIIIVGLNEFYSMARMAKIRPQKFSGILIGGLIFIINFLYAMEFINENFFFIFVPLILIIFINELYLKNNRPFSNIAYTFLGLIYVAVPVSLWNYIVMHTGDIAEGNIISGAVFDPINQMLQPSIKIQYSPGILMGFFIITWLSDTGAYLVGVPFGRRKLFKRISPKKTWEGFLGGAIIALMASYPVSLLFHDLPLIHWLVVAIIVIVMGTFGDLVESLYKRSLGVKDSGHILPGHGGVLDRFDTILLSSPVVFTYLQLLQ